MVCALAPVRRVSEATKLLISVVVSAVFGLQVLKVLVESSTLVGTWTKARVLLYSELKVGIPLVMNLLSVSILVAATI